MRWEITDTPDTISRQEICWAFALFVFRHTDILIHFNV